LVAYHRFTEKLKKKIEEMEHEDNGHEWKMDTGRPVEIPKLDDQMAIEKGANFLGEVIILSIAASILVTGYVGPKKIKEAEQEKRRREKHEHLAKEIRDLHVTVKDLLKEGREKRS